MPISKYFHEALIQKHFAVGICHYFSCPASEIWFLHLGNFLSLISNRTLSCFSTIAAKHDSFFPSLLWSWDSGIWHTALYFKLEASASGKYLQGSSLMVALAVIKWSPHSGHDWGRGTDGGVLGKHLGWNIGSSISFVAWFDGLGPLRCVAPESTF